MINRLRGSAIRQGGSIRHLTVVCHSILTSLGGWGWGWKGNEWCLGAMDNFDLEREKGTGGGGGGRGIPPVEPAVSEVEATADEKPCSFSEITMKSSHNAATIIV